MRLSLSIISGFDKKGRLVIPCLKCKRALDPARGGFVVSTWIPIVKGVPGYPNRDVYIYALCTQCLELVRQDRDWLNWLEDEIVVIEKSSFHMKCGGNDG